MIGIAPRIRAASASAPEVRIVPVQVDTVSIAAVVAAVLPPQVVVAPDVGQPIRIQRWHDPYLVFVDELLDLRIRGVETQQPLSAVEREHDRVVVGRQQHRGFVFGLRWVVGDLQRVDAPVSVGEADAVSRVQVHSKCDLRVGLLHLEELGGDLGRCVVTRVRWQIDASRASSRLCDLTEGARSLHHDDRSGDPPQEGHVALVENDLGSGVVATDRGVRRGVEPALDQTADEVFLAVDDDAQKVRFFDGSEILGLRRLQ